MERVTVDEAKAMMRSNMLAMRAEYTRMRDIAQKRIKRLGESEFRDSKAYKEHPDGFKTLKELDKTNFAKAYSELSKFVTAKASSVSGQRSIMNKTIRSWNKQGIPLAKENYKRTISILEEMRKRKIVYGSDTANELARVTLGLSDEQFSDILDNLELYLTHVDDVADYMETHYDPETGYQMVDMDDFKDEIGW